MTRVVCVQMAPRVGNLELNHQAILAAIGEHPAADLLVLPELATSGYVLTDLAEARGCALAPDDRRVREWAGALGASQVLALGFAELGPDGTVYNSAMLLDRSGIRAVYRKAHLWDTEVPLFRAGDQPSPVVEFSFGRLGLMVCYDLEFPEYTRAAALAGADALVVPTNWPLVDRPSGERPPEVVIAQAAARVNRMAIICADRTGTERGQEWTAGTAVIDHNGWVIGTATNNLIDVELDLTAGRDKRISPHNDVFADRRTELYSEPSEPLT